MKKQELIARLIIYAITGWGVASWILGWIKPQDQWVTYSMNLWIVAIVLLAIAKIKTTNTTKNEDG